MKNNAFSQRLFLFLFALCVACSLPAQDGKQDPEALFMEAIETMDNGNYDESIELLKALKKIDPDNAATYSYEIGLAYYKQEKFEEALSIFKRLVAKHGEESGLYHKMLGNCYDILGQRDKARKAYLAGLEEHPNDGSIYLELGVVDIMEENYNDALNYFEKGIQVDPTHASNYYWAARLFATSNEKLWSLLYAELFLNLEFGTKRSEEISELLYMMYNEVYTMETDTSGEFNLTERGFVIDMASLESFSEDNPRLLPFEGAFAMKFAVAGVVYQGKETMSLADISAARSIFIEAWFGEDSDDQALYPATLLPYLRKIQKRGDLALYDHYLLRYGDPEAFEAFYSENQEAYDRFFEWYEEAYPDFDNGLESRLDFE